MLICEDCGSVFREEDAGSLEERDCGSEGLGGVICSIAVCPDCGSDSLSDAVECPVCGEWHSEEDDDVICDACAKQIRDAWEELKKKFFCFSDENEIARYISEVIL